jgi:hypothetical protein
LLQLPFAFSRTEIAYYLMLYRVTVYHTLRTFEEKGVVHRIVDHAKAGHHAAAGPDATAPPWPTTIYSSNARLIGPSAA